MLDQLIIGDKASYDDFGASLAKGKKAQPKKKSVKETVPFSNVTYDFSAIDGEIYWEQRQLQYIFEMTAPTPERLEDMKAAFANWMMNIVEQEIHDPYIPDYHFIGTYEDMDFEDEDGMEKTTVTVTFAAYPYKVANHPRYLDFKVPAHTEKTVYIQNNSSHRIVPTITTDGGIVLMIDNTSYTLAEGTTSDASLMFEAGANRVTLKNTSSAARNVQVKFWEEVF